MVLDTLFLPLEDTAVRTLAYPDFPLFAFQRLNSDLYIEMGLVEKAFSPEGFFSKIGHEPSYLFLTNSQMKPWELVQ